MLDALVRYYEQLVTNQNDEVAPIGWCTRRISYIAELSEKGELLAVTPITDRKKMMRMVPNQAKRAVNIAANFLCDNSTYMFGADAKGKPDRALKCFEAARDLHNRILSGVESPCAEAIRAFFSAWNPSEAAENDAIALVGDKFFAGGNIIFNVWVSGECRDPIDDPSARNAWEEYSREEDDDDLMRCLVTGDYTKPARLHPAIRGVYGAQSAGASLVSFNARAFESYGHDKEQGRNAPVGEYAAQAYATALNYLLDKPNHHIRLGETTIVYWSEHNDRANCTCMSYLFGARIDDEIGDTDEIVNAMMRAVAEGRYRELEGIDPDAIFYMVGIAPSAARLSVKFFLRNSFGHMLNNIGKHYRRTEMVHAPYEKDYLTPYQLLREVEQPKAKKPVVIPVLNAPLLKAIIEDVPYPAALYANALLRIHATQENPDEHVRKVTRGRAAIIRGYLIKNRNSELYNEEVLTMALNEERNETAYCLGRAFAILERIQEIANDKATITNKYFNTASTSPASVFPVLLRLSNAHIKKIGREKEGVAMWLRNQLHNVLSEKRVASFPRRLSTDEQGDFMLGYIHQRNKWFERKEESKVQIGTEEE